MSFLFVIWTILVMLTVLAEVSSPEPIDWAWLLAVASVSGAALLVAADLGLR